MLKSSVCMLCRILCQSDRSGPELGPAYQSCYQVGPGVDGVAADCLSLPPCRTRDVKTSSFARAEGTTQAAKRSEDDHQHANPVDKTDEQIAAAHKQGQALRDSILSLEHEIGMWPPLHLNARPLGRCIRPTRPAAISLELAAAMLHSSCRVL